MKYRLTKKQEEALELAKDTAPKGRRGNKWLGWANGVLSKAKLPPVTVTEPPKGSSMAAATAGGKPTRLAGLAAAAEAAAGSKPKRASGMMKFVVDSGQLHGPSGLVIPVTGGVLSGHFEVTTWQQRHNSSA